MSNYGGSGIVPIWILDGSFGPIGPTGPTGATGATGATGSCLPGNTGLGIIGITVDNDDIVISFGTAGFAVTINNEIIRGATGTTFNNLSEWNIQGATTNGQQIFRTFNPLENQLKSVTFSADPSNPKKLEFFGLTFINIAVKTSSDTLISLTAITNVIPLSGITGQLAYVDKANNIIVSGATGTDWNKNRLSYTGRSLLELDSFSSTATADNYTSNQITGITNTQRIGINGVSGNVTVVRPVISFANSTYQPGMVISNPSGKDWRIPFLSADYNTAGSTATLLTGGATLGSCWIADIQDPRKRCVDFLGKDYCSSIGGSWSSNPCSTREEVFSSLKACCLYDYATNGIICINTFESECLRMMGVPGNVKCEVYETIMNKCPTDLCFTCEIGRCCYKGNCFERTESECFLLFPGGVWFSGETC